MPMTKPIRELTDKEIRKIRKLVTQHCANYDPEYGCLPLDCECVMLGKAYCGNAMCKYFREWVLPNDPELNAALQNLAASDANTVGNRFLQRAAQCTALILAEMQLRERKPQNEFGNTDGKRWRCNDLSRKSVAALREFYTESERWCK